MRPFHYYPPAIPQPPMPTHAAWGGGIPAFARPPAVPPIPPMSAAPVAAAPKLENFLQTASTFMNQAQKFTPYVQQAAPMIKNLPALWRMYRGLSDSPGESSTVQAPQRPVRQRQMPTERLTERPTERQPLIEKPSIPRIYQPPFHEN